MGIDYDNITDDQIEELAEFIDWSMISPELVSDGIRKRFSCFPEARLNFWFDKLFSNTISALNPLDYPKSIYFIRNESVFLEIDIEKLDVWHSNDRVCDLVSSTYMKSNDKMVVFLKNIVNKHFEKLKIINVNHDIWLEITCKTDEQLLSLEIVSRKTVRRDNYPNQIASFSI